MSRFTNIRWKDAQQTAVVAISAEGFSATIPVAAGNADWDWIIQSDAQILPFVSTSVDPLTLPLDRLTFWLAAAAIGVSKWSVRDNIAAMADGLEKLEAIAWFEEASVYRRNDPLLIHLADMEGIPQGQLDTLWAWAAAS